MKKQIIALGGGGFSMEANLAIDRYILSQAMNKRPKICFLGTASGDAQSYIDKFYGAYKKLECRPSHLSLFKPFTSDIESFLLSQDVVFVGGGNTKSMLAVWREWQVDEVLRKAYDQGVVLSGLSAGSICWFEHGVTDSIPGSLSVLPCLGFLKGSHCPHYESEPARRPSYEKLIENDLISRGMAADDGVAVHYIDGVVSAVVSSKEDSKAFLVSKNGGDIEEKVLEPKLLSAVPFGTKSVERVYSHAPWETKVGYCRALKVGHQIFVTGTAPINDDGTVHAPGNAYAQARRCLELVERAFEKLGADLSSVTRTRMFVTNIKDWEAFGKAHAECFARNPPTTTMVEVKSLIDPKMLIEIEVDAIVSTVT